METMDDRMEYKPDTAEKYSGSLNRWQMRAASALSFESGDSIGNLTPQEQHLQYFPRKETLSPRRLIPATWPEMLSYYRSYVTTPCKTQILAMQYIHFNRFVWFYIPTLFFKSLPHTYVQVFLATYSKNDHFSVGKMVPFAYGAIVIYVIAAFSEIVMYMDFLAVLFDFTINGIINKNPWNRCDANITMQIYNDQTETVICYDINRFSKMVMEEKPGYWMYAYVHNGVFIQMAPMVYHEKRYVELYNSTGRFHVTLIFWYILFLWLLMHLLHLQLFNRYLWKTHHIVQWIVNGFYICILIHLAQDYFIGQLENKGDIPDEQFFDDQHWSSDSNMISESMTAPPIIHILTSRNKRETLPSRDSSVIIISNGIYYILKGLLGYRMKKYCESVIQTSIFLTRSRPHTFFYLWPLYFSTFYMGDLYTIAFFALHFVMEFCTIGITYQCLIELVTCEWRLANRYIVTFIFMIIGICGSIFTEIDETKTGFYLGFEIVAAIVEIFVIYIAYPIDRLIDDITFFTGVVPTWLRIMNLRLVPVYYSIKLYLMTTSSDYFKRLHVAHFERPYNFIWFSVILSFIMVLGLIYTILKYVCIKKKGWISLLIPDENWGPEYSVRQVRKQYDSRTYVRSQAPKQLSRYMIQKAEALKYSLNLNYNLNLRRSMTDVSVQLQYEDEKKNV